ncbi:MULTISPECIES: sensor histidine kinase [unclassified Cupriavidus]|uniref:sensor histidine kinase n=1 Tax=unclassified Cupriavidus TaxID=2640874 RepID=UPI00313BE29B
MSDGQPFSKSVDEAFHFAPIPILIEDWSHIKQWVDTIKACGVTDLRDYIECNPHVIGELRALHAFVDANDAAVRLFGGASREALLEAAKKLLPANRTSNAKVLQAIFDGAETCEGERTLTTLHGKSVPIVWRCALPNDPVRYRRLHFYAFDVTEYKENSDRLQALRAEMAHTARISLVGQLAASVLHEIGQPLSSTMISIDAALVWLERERPSTVEAAAAIRDAARWARDASVISSRLRGFMMRAPVLPTPLLVDEAVEAALFLVGPDAAAKQVTVVKRVGPDLEVFADRVQLHQVLGNLLANGIQAIHAAERFGARELMVSAEPVTGGMVLFEVGDSGKGVSDTVSGTLFEAFVSARPEGLGLGLTVAKAIVQAHGGDIWVESSTGAGTRIRFTIPSSLAAR